MNRPYFKIGSLDITEYIAENGLKQDNNDVDSPYAGRTLDAYMWRGKVAEKVKFTVTCVPVRDSVYEAIRKSLSNEYVTVYTNMGPSREDKVYEMYNSSRTGTVTMYDENYNAVWDSVQFSLIER